MNAVISTRDVGWDKLGTGLGHGIVCDDRFSMNAGGLICLSVKMDTVGEPRFFALTLEQGEQQRQAVLGLIKRWDKK